MTLSTELTSRRFHFKVIHLALSFYCWKLGSFPNVNLQSYCTSKWEKCLLRYFLFLNTVIDGSVQISSAVIWSYHKKLLWGFPGSSAGKTSTCNAGDPSSIPGLGRDRIPIPVSLGFPDGFLVAQMVKNLPAMWETWVQSLDWEGPLEKGMATHSSILAWRIPWTVRGVAKSWTQLSDFHFKKL